MRRYSPFSMTLAWVQVRPERYQSTGQGRSVACGGRKTAKVISVPQTCDSCEKTPCIPPKAVFSEMMFIVIPSSFTGWLRLAAKLFHGL